jgi:hypothetical protein
MSASSAMRARDSMSPAAMHRAHAFRMRRANAPYSWFSTTARVRLAVKGFLTVPRAVAFGVFDTHPRVATSKMLWSCGSSGGYRCVNARTVPAKGILESLTATVEG